MKKFNKPLAEDMKSGFKKAETSLDDIGAEVKLIADQLAGGSLLGLTGDALYNALAITLKQRIDSLSAKMNELASDVEKARDDFERAEYENWLRFQNGGTV